MVESPMAEESAIFPEAITKPKLKPVSMKLAEYADALTNVCSYAHIRTRAPIRVVAGVPADRLTLGPMLAFG